MAKHEDIELAQQADGLVTKWMKLVKNNDDTKEKDRERRKERKDKDRSSKRGDEKKKVRVAGLCFRHYKFCQSFVEKKTSVSTAWMRTISRVQFLNCIFFTNP